MRFWVATFVGVALLAVASAVAAPIPASRQRLDSTVRYLQEIQQANGGFAKAGEPGQITSAWVALALAAAGINPQDQARPGGVDANTFLVDHFQQAIGEELCAPHACTTTLERELMVANASGTSPHDFGGVDLARELLARARPDGSFPFVPDGRGEVNDTIFAIFALAPIGEPAAQAPIQHAADWVEAAQQGSGGWAWSDRNGLDEVDMTGAAIQALVAAGRNGTAPVRNGLAYLRAAQNPDGGFPEYPGDPESNVASTAWATQAIWSVGENPEEWLTGFGGESEEPLDYMESLQEADGHLRWKRSSDANGVWMTAQAAPAIFGQSWPIPAAPRAKPPSASPRPGQGEGTQSGKGTVAGGGSAGAPLFSRPRPQSKGRTPGGARLVHNSSARSVNHSESRHGDVRQPAGTETSEPKTNPGPLSAVAASAGHEAGGDAGSGSKGSSLPPALGTAGSEAQAPPGSAVTGTLVGSSEAGRHGALAFGAPGLHSAGDQGERWLAIGIGVAALMLALGGAQWERRRGELVL